MTFGLPIRHGRTLPFLRKPHKILKIVLWVTPNNSATSRADFLIPKTSQMIRHRKSVLRGEGIFQTKEQIQTACSFQSETKNPTERKFLMKTRFFTCWTMTSEKCTRAHVQENKSIYLSIYLSIWKPFWKRVYKYITIIHRRGGEPRSKTFVYYPCFLLDVTRTRNSLKPFSFHLQSEN